MKYAYLIILLCFANGLYAQNYPNLLNYNLNGTPTYGVKIKTNLPFTPGSQMPTIHIEGYNYGSDDVIGLDISYYVYTTNNFQDPSGYYVHAAKISSSGGYTPKVFLSNESGKVIIYIDDKVYFQRFTVSAYAQGMQEVSSWFQGWTVVDEPLNGTKTVELPYRNRFKGDVFLPESGIWNALGNVGIGTTNPTEKLSVNGKIRAKEIKVETANWPDYVFEDDYPMLSLAEIEKYIKTNKHLPEMPSSTEAEANGIALGELNKLLLKKIEELTLHLIEKDKQLLSQKEQLEKVRTELTTQLTLQEERLHKIEKLLKNKID